MTIGVPKEVKDHEARVGLVPSGVAALRQAGHTVLVEAGAGAGSAIPDREYVEAGARILPNSEEIWGSADMVVKVKEPQPSEYGRFHSGLILFTFLHLAPLSELTERLLQARVSALAYETVRAADGSLPLLTPMSEVAGRLSVQAGAAYLEAHRGGRGVLLGGVPGVAPADVLILGAGVVGDNAARMALGMGARVTIIDKSLKRLREMDAVYGGRLVTLASNAWNIRESLRHADLVIGAILVAGASAPKLITRDMLSSMRRGSVIVDVCIDQGGCVETSRPTSYSDPAYAVDGIIHYCISNMPAAVPRTSTLALTNATLPYVIEVAGNGLEQSCDSDPSIRAGLNTYRGYVTHAAVAQSQGRPFREFSALR
jgi:alanine dehydrogenase